MTLQKKIKIIFFKLILLTKTWNGIYFCLLGCSSSILLTKKYFNTSCLWTIKDTVFFTLSFRFSIALTYLFILYRLFLYFLVSLNFLSFFSISSAFPLTAVSGVKHEAKKIFLLQLLCYPTVAVHILYATLNNQRSPRSPLSSLTFNSHLINSITKRKSETEVS